VQVVQSMRTPPSCAGHRSSLPVEQCDGCTWASRCTASTVCPRASARTCATQPSLCEAASGVPRPRWNVPRACARSTIRTVIVSAGVCMGWQPWHARCRSLGGWRSAMRHLGCSRPWEARSTWCGRRDAPSRVLSVAIGMRRVEYAARLHQRGCARFEPWAEEPRALCAEPVSRSDYAMRLRLGGIKQYLAQEHRPRAGTTQSVR